MTRDASLLARSGAVEPLDGVDAHTILARRGAAAASPSVIGKIAP